MRTMLLLVVCLLVGMGVQAAEKGLNILVMVNGKCVIRHQPVAVSVVVESRPRVSVPVERVVVVRQTEVVHREPPRFVPAETCTSLKIVKVGNLVLIQRETVVASPVVRVYEPQPVVFITPQPRFYDYSRYSHRQDYRDRDSHRRIERRSRDDDRGSHHSRH